MSLTGILIGAAILGSAGYMFWAARQRHWNAGGEDDRRRLVGDRIERRDLADRTGEEE